MVFSVMLSMVRSIIGGTLTCAGSILADSGACKKNKSLEQELKRIQVCRNWSLRISDSDGSGVSWCAGDSGVKRTFCGLCSFLYILFETHKQADLS